MDPLRTFELGNPDYEAWMEEIPSLPFLQMRERETYYEFIRRMELLMEWVRCCREDARELWSRRVTLSPGFPRPLSLHFSLPDSPSRVDPMSASASQPPLPSPSPFPYYHIRVDSPPRLGYIRRGYGVPADQDEGSPSYRPGNWSTRGYTWIDSSSEDYTVIGPDISGYMTRVPARRIIEDSSTEEMEGLRSSGASRVLEADMEDRGTYLSPGSGEVRAEASQRTECSQTGVPTFEVALQGSGLETEPASDEAAGAMEEEEPDMVLTADLDDDEDDPDLTVGS